MTLAVSPGETSAGPPDWIAHPGKGSVGLSSMKSLRSFAVLLSASLINDMLWFCSPLFSRRMRVQPEGVELGPWKLDPSTVKTISVAWPGLAFLAMLVPSIKSLLVSPATAAWEETLADSDLSPPPQPTLIVAAVATMAMRVVLNGDNEQFGNL